MVGVDIFGLRLVRIRKIGIVEKIGKFKFGMNEGWFGWHFRQRNSAENSIGYFSVEWIAILTILISILTVLLKLIFVLITRFEYLIVNIKLLIFININPPNVFGIIHVHKIRIEN